MGAKAKRWVPFRGAVETTHSWSSVMKSRHTSHSIIIDNICQYRARRERGSSELRVLSTCVDRVTPEPSPARRIVVDACV